MSLDKKTNQIQNDEMKNKAKSARNMLMVLLGSQLATGPFERVKILMQTRDSLNKLGKQIPNSSVKCFAKIVKDQGITALWQSSRQNIMKNQFQIGIQTWMYDSLKKISFPNGESNYQGQDRFLRRVWAGFNCGSFTTLLLYPIELLRVYSCCEITANKKELQYNKWLRGQKVARRNGGFMALYRGFTFTLFTSSLFIGTTLATFDEQIAYKTRNNNSQLFFLNSSQEEEQNSQKNITQKMDSYFDAAIVASLQANLLQYPIDSFKRRYMLVGFEGNRVLHKNSYQLIKGIYKNDGLFSLYKGMPISVIRTFVLILSQGITRDLIYNSEQK